MMGITLIQTLSLCEIIQLLMSANMPSLDGGEWSAEDEPPLFPRLGCRSLLMGALSSETSSLDVQRNVYNFLFDSLANFADAMSIPCDACPISANWERLALFAAHQALIARDLANDIF